MNGDTTDMTLNKQAPCCLGCNLANLKEPVHLIYENDLLTCILDHDPFNNGHTLILPKKHYEDVDDLDEETAHAIIQCSMVISKALKSIYKPDGITICQNGGIFSELTHFHMHVVPRYKGQSFASFYLDEPFNNEHLKKRIADAKTEMYQALRKYV